MDETHGSTDSESHQETGRATMSEKEARKCGKPDDWWICVSCGSWIAPRIIQCPECYKLRDPDCGGLVYAGQEALLVLAALKILGNEGLLYSQELWNQILYSHDLLLNTLPVSSDKKHEGVGEKTKTESCVRDKQAGAAQEDAEWAKEATERIMAQVQPDKGQLPWENEKLRVEREIQSAINSATASLRARNAELERRLKEFGGTQSRG